MTTETPTHTIVQHLLSSDGPSTVELPSRSRLLDIHLIDGRYFLRTVEPLVGDHADVKQITITPATFGTKLSIEGLTPLPVRAGGLHFFATE